MPLTTVVPRALQPVSLAEARLHLRVDLGDDDALIAALIVAATDEAEHLMQRALLPATLQLTLDGFGPGGCGEFGSGGSGGGSAAIVLQRPAVSAVVSVRYLQAADGALATLAPAGYSLAAADAYSARLVPAWGAVWPATRAVPEAVRIQFTAGYPDPASVPEPVKSWIKLRVGALYTHRDAWTAGRAIEPNPFIDRMLDAYAALSF